MRLTLLVCCMSVLASCAGKRPVAEEPAAPPAPTEPVARVDPEVEHFRTPGPRAQETIFSPLPWREASEERLASGVPGPAYWQNRADYVIHAALDETANRITGRERLTYTNNSPHTLDYIWINLEQNLFNPESKGARLTRPGARFGNRDGHEGGFELGPVRRVDPHTVPSPGDEPAPQGAAGAPPIVAGMMPHQPEGEALSWHVFDTVARLDLNPPLAPGQVLTLDLEFAYVVPDYGSDRTGIEAAAAGKIFEIAQWFPAVCKYDDVHGWNHLPYLGQGEFYTDFGDFEVSLTVPRSHLVAAPGVLLNPEEVLTPAQRERLEQARASKDTVMIRTPEEVADPASRPAGEGPLTWRFEAENIRTFAWASSASFIWDAAAVQGSHAHTLAQSMYPAEALPTWSESTDMLRWSIEHYSTMWFEYPYPVATNVSGVVGGMEYPQIIFCRGRGERRGLFGVTTHEIGHNWFPMIVATDERRYPWMDEGFNTFINYYSSQGFFPGNEPGRGGARVFAGGMLRPMAQPLMTYADQIRGRALGQLAYAKTSVGLVLLREFILGPERFDFAFRRYISQWAFRSPRPEDFFRTMQDATGEDLDWFWRGWFYETAVLDLAVEGVNYPTRRSGQPTGLVEVTFLCNRDLVMPIEFDVSYTDGSTERRRIPVECWFNTTRWTTQWPIGDKRIARVELDPRGLTPDVDPLNDTWNAPVENAP